MNFKYRNFRDYIVHSLFPSRCPYCDKPIIPNSPCCNNCKSNKENLNIVRNIENSICISPFIYDGIYKKSVLNFKFNNRPDYSQPFSIDICEAIHNKIDEIDFDYITCVPASKKSYIQRGYNQSELLAKEISINFNIKFAKTIIKVKNTGVQHKINNAEERKLNVKGAFDFNNKYNIDNKKILLVDDIITTGATLNECCKVLYKFGAYKVICASYVSVTM